jgi:GH24 family phage-related lysozyme (muramidase)
MIGYHYKAMNFIKDFEGFNENAVYDVNAWRIGYGSDTITFNNGSFRKVKQGDKTTKQNAEKDLKRRIPEFEKKVINYLEGKGIKKRYWERLPDPAKIGLLSFAYNYGNIVKNSIREAIKTGNVDIIADAVITSTINDNKGTVYYNGLRKRRQKEADLIRSQKLKMPIILKIGIPVLVIAAIYELTK